MSRSSILSGLVWKIIFTFVFALSLCELLFKIPQVKKMFYAIEQQTGPEAYNPGLSRINSLAKLEVYTDSLYQQSIENIPPGLNRYPLIIGNVIRNRFYHGYLTYDIGNNFLAMLAGKISGRTYDAIVKADEILKYSGADCRQQSLVMMELLRKKGYSVRAVYLKSKKYNDEHYSFETFYSNAWHFSDPDLEPDADMLLHKNRPSVALLARDSLLLTNVYSKQDPGKITDLFKSYQYGKVNEIVPARLYILHTITKWGSNLAVVLCIIIYFVFMRNTNRAPKTMVSLPGMQKPWKTVLASLF